MRVFEREAGLGSVFAHDDVTDDVGPPADARDDLEGVSGGQRFEHLAELDAQRPRDHRDGLVEQMRQLARLERELPQVRDGLLFGRALGEQRRRPLAFELHAFALLLVSPRAEADVEPGPGDVAEREPAEDLSVVRPEVDGEQVARAARRRRRQRVDGDPEVRQPAAREEDDRAPLAVAHDAESGLYRQPREAGDDVKADEAVLRGDQQRQDRDHCFSHDRLLASRFADRVEIGGGAETC